MQMRLSDHSTIQLQVFDHNIYQMSEAQHPLQHTAILWLIGDTVSKRLGMLRTDRNKKSEVLIPSVSRPSQAMSHFHTLTLEMELLVKIRPLSFDSGDFCDFNPVKSYLIYSKNFVLNERTPFFSAFWATIYWHTESETKWQPFCTRHFQIHFFQWKYMNFDWNVTELSS